MKRFIRENKAVVIMMLVYFIVVGTVAVLRHYTFQTQTWDLGAFTQTMFNASEGRGLTNSLEDVPNHLGIHMSPFLFLLIPFYFVFQSPYALLIIQTLALALGALPLYLLAKEILNQRWASILSFSYLIFPSLHAINLFDFHSVAFAVSFFLAALYFIHRENLLWSSVFLILAASTKENAIITTVFIGLFIVLTNPPMRKTGFSIIKRLVFFLSLRRISLRQQDKENIKFKSAELKKMRNFGAAVFLIASIYFYLTVTVFMPAAGGGLVRFDRYANLGSTSSEIIQNITQEPGLLAETVLTPDKASYVARLFLPVLYVSLLAPLYLLPLVAGLVQNLLTFFDFQFSSLYQYDSILIPFIFFSAIFGIRKMTDLCVCHPELAEGSHYTRSSNIIKIQSNALNATKLGMTRDRILKYLPWGLLLASLISFGFFSILSPRNLPFERYQVNQRTKTFQEIVKQIPDNVSVTAHTNLVPHLAHRELILMQGTGQVLTDIFILDSTDPFPFTSEADYQAYLDKILETNLYKVNIIDDRYFVLVRK